MDRKELENLEVPPGVGAAAILLFLHIATVGYVGYVMWYFLLSGNFWSLFIPKASWGVFFPVFWGILTYLPTDKLTRIVGRTALGFSLAAALVVVGGLIVKFFSTAPEAVSKLNGIYNLTGGLIAAVLQRLAFKNLLINHETGTNNPPAGFLFLGVSLLILLSLLYYSTVQ